MPAAVARLMAPEPLSLGLDDSRFSSGVPALDAWPRGIARLNEAKGGSRTYILAMAAASQASAGPLRVQLRSDGFHPVLAGASQNRSPSSCLDSSESMRTTKLKAFGTNSSSTLRGAPWQPFSDREPLMLILRVFEPRALLEP